ncbi:S8 family serine peptidase [Streptobacillus canis]|uniref:S8 family serine peptidase n=1 Tax=Streptobacillus canis TaxID=2678686 RepID=UPI0012E0EDA0|nr:autotransporter domain-containing protein [Streptobacillus canis]
MQKFKKYFFSSFLLFNLIACSSAGNIDNINMDNDKKRDDNIIKPDKVYIIESGFSKISSDKIINEFKVKTKGAQNGSSNHAYEVFKVFIKNHDDFANYEKNDVNKNDVEVRSIDQKYYPLSGIINMSYGISNSSDYLHTLNENDRYIDKAGAYTNRFEKHYLSSLIFDKNYKENKVLKIKALGNTSNAQNKDKIFSSEVLNSYQVMSPDIQRAARAESIFVAAALSENEFKKLFNGHINENAKIYTDKDNINYYHNNIGEITKYNAYARPLLLRSFTVSTPNYISLNEKNVYGTSVGAPRVTRLAYELKKKYPFLTYQQIKQVILTTAKRKAGKDEFLDNNVGWGIVDYEKAIKGPSDFNAGLIEEQKYFKDIRSKIYDTDNNRYFYVNIDENKEYSFDNDITSGLKGKIDDIKNHDEIYEINGRKYRTAKVLTSEKLFYKQNGAGLYKDGIGTLILNGKQLYNTKTYINEGTLILKNDSESKYIVQKNANFKVDNNKNELKLSEIYNSGNVYFNSKLNLEKYEGDNNSLTYIGENTKIEAKHFKTNGALRYINNNISNNNLSLLKSKIVINKKNINSLEELKGSINLENLYLKPKVTENDNEYIIEFEPLTKKLRDAKHKEDLPSYDVNENNFFKSYRINSDNYYTTTARIYNLASSDKERLKKEVFTDMYSTFFNDLLEGQNLKTNNDENMKYFLSNKKTNLYFNIYNTFNLSKSNNYTAFSKKNNIYTLGFNNKFSKIYNLGLNFSLLKQKYNFENNMGSFNNTSYILGINNIFGNDFKLENDINISRNYTNILRNIENDSINNKVLSTSFKILTNISKDFKINNTSITPKIGYEFNMLSIEKSKKEENSFGLTILNNTLLNHSMLLSLNTKTKINNNFVINNNVQAKLNLNNKNNFLNVNLADIDTKFSGKNLDKFKLMYSLGIGYKNFNINTTIDTNKNLGLGLSLIF